MSIPRVKAGASIRHPKMCELLASERCNVLDRAQRTFFAKLHEKNARYLARGMGQFFVTRKMLTRDFNFSGGQAVQPGRVIVEQPVRVLVTEGDRTFDRARNWTHGVLGCCSHCGNCCCGSFFFPCLACQSAERLGGSGKNKK